MEATQTQGLGTVPADARPKIVPRGFRAVRNTLSERHWVRKDPYATAFFNALSAVFPHGETFMIRSLVPWVERVPPSLGQEVNAFIEQEAGHSREHVAMNRGLVDAGYDIEPLDRKIRGFVKFFEDASDMVKLTATMCIEHFTAIIAAELLKNKGHLEGTEDDLRELWLWHAIEEVEHKGVAYDVWKFASRDWNPVKRYMWRSLFMVAVTTSFFINRTLGQVELLRQDGFAFWPSLARVMRTGFGKGGIGRNVLHPWADFFRPGFHPWDKDDRLLLARGEAELAHIKARRAGYACSDEHATEPLAASVAA
ncbi:MAG: metal-dependent hydrolase [Sphingorhabdus sp.]